jgi:hypothetical protein
MFHILLLVLVDPETLLEIKAVATDETTKEYEVKKIIDIAIKDG